MTTAFNWRAVQALNGGKEYLAYTIARGQADIDNNTLNRIMRGQLQTFTKRFNQVNKTHYSGQQIKKLMDEWSSNGGQIGQNIDAAMQNIAKFDRRGIAKSYSTSGDISVDGVSLANAGAAFSSSVESCLGHVSSIVNAVDGAVNNIITTIAENWEWLIAARLIDAYYKDGNVPEDIQSIANCIDTSINAGMVKESDTKIVLAMETVRANLDTLSSLGGGSTNVQETFQSAVDSIAAAFNSIGGTVHEMAQAHAINVASQAGQEAIAKTNEEIKKIVSSAGGQFYSNWTAQDSTTLEGKESKEDVHISWNKNNIILEFGGNIKLRQSAPFQGSGPGSQALGVEGFVARSMTYKQLAKRLNSFSAGAGQYGYSLVGALGTQVDTMDWYNIRQAIGALSLVDAISGSGIKGDYSSLLIVNNKIFSIYDIVRKIYDNSDSILKYGGNKYYIVEGFDLGTIRSKIMSSQSGGNVFSKALRRNRLAYQVLNNTKISITLNMGHLFSPTVFQS